MATITGLTAERMLAIEAAAIVDGNVVGDNLVLTRHDGTPINTGNVRGPAGPVGPVGSDLAAAASLPVLEIGLSGQIRAGRQLAATDFTDMGLSIPVGLWNLSDVNDASGNGRTLLNKGAVTFAPGINGQPATSAKFIGSVAQGLYIADTGAADPFRIKTGSWGCWFRTTKRGTSQFLVTKWGTQLGWCMYVHDTNGLAGGYSTNGTNFELPLGVSDVADGRWHFGVVTYDGSFARLYVDTILEASSSAVNTGPMFGSSAPLNLGNNNMDAANSGSSASFGQMDEAFVTSDVLTEDQIRMLYCAKLSHTLGSVPSRVNLNIRRRRRGAAFVVADFSAPPLRLYNFSGGSLADQGTNNVIPSADAGVLPVGGPDGTPQNALQFFGAQALIATDAGLPSGLNPRSYGCWARSVNIPATGSIFSWGTGDGGISLGFASGGTPYSINYGTDQMNGPFAADGLWHFIVVTETNTPVDGIKRKMYVDGRLVRSSILMSSITMGGANSFRIGDLFNGAVGWKFNGGVDGIFITNYAMSVEEVMALYAKGSQALAPSPKNAGDHVEGLTATDLLVTFDTLDTTALVDLKVAT